MNNFIENEPAQDSSIYSSLKINKDMLDKFNRFLKKAFPENFDKYTVDFSGVDKSDVAKIKAMWSQYLYGNFQVQDSLEQVMLLQHISDSIKEASILKQKTDSLEQAVAKASDTSNESNHEKLSNSHDNNELSAKNENEAPKPGKFNKKTTKRSTSFNESSKLIELSTKENIIQSQKISVAKNDNLNLPLGTEYRVQIAASRIPMQEKELSTIYLGSARFTESFEDNWYKYISDPFDNYDSANNFRISIQVNGAFVAFYYQGHRIKRNATINTDFSNSFKIQIAASKKPLSDIILKSIYNGNDSIAIKYDGIWYHYVILNVKSFEEAQEKLKEIPVKGAFIVKYQGDQRIYPPLPEENNNEK